MAKMYKTERREVESVIQIATICDLCGAESVSEEWASNPPPDTGWWDISDGIEESGVEISYRWTSPTDPYGGGAIGRLTEIDLCPNCFNNKLIPALKQINPDFEPTVHELDY
jgi:hypothetical protein